MLPCLQPLLCLCLLFYSVVRVRSFTVECVVMLSVCLFVFVCVCLCVYFLCVCLCVQCCVAVAACVCANVCGLPSPGQ